MRPVDNFAIHTMEKMTKNTTEQKDYIGARQRAAQFNNPYSVATPITRVSSGESHVNDFSENKSIFNGVHHAKK